MFVGSPGTVPTENIELLKNTEKCYLNTQATSHMKTVPHSMASGRGTGLMVLLPFSDDQGQALNEERIYDKPDIQPGRFGYASTIGKHLDK